MSASPQSQDVEAIRRDIERTRQDMDRTLAALEDRVSPSRIKDRQTAKVRDRWDQVRSSVMGAADDAGGRASGAAEDARHRAQDVTRSAQETVQSAPDRIERVTRGNPLAAGLVAFGAGALVASLLPPSRPEQRVATELRGEFEGPVRDQMQQAGQQVKDDLQQHAQEAADDTKQAAQDAVERTRQEAQDHGQQVQAEVREAADDVRAAGGGDSPPVSALKAEWVDYATSRGMDRATAEEHTKDELIERFG